MNRFLKSNRIFKSCLLVSAILAILAATLSFTASRLTFAHRGVEQAVDPTIVDLGSLGGGDQSGSANAVNNNGQIVGSYSTANGYRAFLYSNGVMTNLGTLGGTDSYATTINEVGQVAGYSNSASGQRHAFLYSNGVMTDLGTLGGTASYAVDINGAGRSPGTPTASGQHDTSSIATAAMMTLAPGRN